MSWLDVLKLMVLMLSAMCVICVAVSVNNDGRAKTEFIRAHGRYPWKAETDPDAKRKE